ncbi:MAG: GNAT family N-acetyltransferase [Candidatus Saccharimonadales bacterium]
MAVNFEIADSKDWDALVSESPHSTPFHEFTWGETIAEQFQAVFKPFIAIEADRQWLVPAYQNLPGQSVGIKVGSIGYGGPLPDRQVIDGEDELKKSILILEALAKTVGASSLQATLYPAEFWSEHSAPDEVSFGSTCKVALAGDEQSVFDGTLTSTVRRAIRKSEKSDVVVRELRVGDEEDEETSLALLHKTQEEVGSDYLTQGTLLDAINKLDQLNLTGKTFVAEVDAETAGMVTCVYDKNELFHLFHGWDRSYADSRVNQALIWTMIRHAIDRSIPSFNMGESHTSGIREAKLRWGGHMESVPRIRL